MLVLLKRNFFWGGKLYERNPEGTEVDGITKKDLPSDAEELSEKVVIDPKKEGDEAIALSQLGKKAPGKPLGT